MDFPLLSSFWRKTTNGQAGLRPGYAPRARAVIKEGCWESAGCFQQTRQEEYDVFPTGADSKRSAPLVRSAFPDVGVVFAVRPRTYNDVGREV